ncbi:PAP2 superfamily protein [Cyclobacterium xiamenense]|uniref:PAP2 superfamily protein n=1 Tax=Cyclobacterium xiamenense TaxID=1297121 RepID=A0A1H7B2J1_9BACT|nr:vanadium-dependent haloperoxidase [Cyclobacterium xiamenense]SEJ71134.1 PAP2 superfamily protein [Cyclobacterium xiamenense]
MTKLLYTAFLFFFVGYLHPLYAVGTNPPDSEREKQELDWMIDHLFSITEVMVNDVASPPGAARFYSYSLLAAHLAFQQGQDFAADPLLSQLKGPFPNSLPTLPSEKEPSNTSFSAQYAMLEVGKRLMPSGKKLQEAQEKLQKQYLSNRYLKKRDMAELVVYGEQLAQWVIDYAAEDGYRFLSTLKRYSPSGEEGKWYPTPPAYMAAIDPEWRTIRPFFLDKASDFAPPPPAPFSLDPGSSFYEQLHEIYRVTGDLDEEQQLIANFWDCNPFNVTYSGHMAIGLKKITPGGHWIGITGIACKDAGLNVKQSIYIHSLVAMSLHDAFISCWDEKYRSDRIRPLTAINEHIDDTWRPQLQTPPFPEYTSGHSVISRTSAIILTDFFGEGFEFIDTSEVFFGLPERAFDSFLQASDEAAISRLYGGIHFRDAIEEGTKQGDAIAQYILKKVNSPKEMLLSNE